MVLTGKDMMFHQLVLVISINMDVKGKIKMMWKTILLICGYDLAPKHCLSAHSNHPIMFKLYLKGCDRFFCQ
jgi:hypothetical protein